MMSAAARVAREGKGEGRVEAAPRLPPESCPERRAGEGLLLHPPGNTTTRTTTSQPDCRRLTCPLQPPLLGVLLHALDSLPLVFPRWSEVRVRLLLCARYFRLSMFHFCSSLFHGSVGLPPPVPRSSPVCLWTPPPSSRFWMPSPRALTKNSDTVPFRIPNWPPSFHAGKNELSSLKRPCRKISACPKEGKIVSVFCELPRFNLTYYFRL
ncbi:uncharacterized protein LOC143832508 isoform X2 [Paroedura picta]|uniref:uncharacterized protein LOC143832508 isoform X2 n=1 Tax=Paroedura picta TaxID=143630 RepID=UPI004057B40A